MNRLEWSLLAATVLLAATTSYFVQELRVQRDRSEVDAPVPAANSTQLPAVGIATVLTARQAAKRADAPSSEPIQPVAAEVDPGQLAVARLRLERWQDPQFRAEEALQAEQSLRQFLGDGVEMMSRIVMPGMELPAAEIERVIGPLTQQALIDRERQLECASRTGCDIAALEDATDRNRELQLITLLGAPRVENYKARLDAFQPEAVRQ